ncbi:MAG: RNA polymerase sigma factor [Robiginitomaculum sp.]|nr:RNA polymerase sigma factor [Robiginitomaculum sp.]
MQQTGDHKNKRLFEALVRDHQGQIRAFLRRLCKNHSLADDLAQDTFLRAYQKFGSLVDAKSAKAWLFQIAYRTFLDYVRKENRRRNLSDLYLPKPESIEQGKPSIKMDIEQAMNALSSEQRAAVLLNLSYGLSHFEITKALGLPLGTVKSHIARGKTALRAFLTAYERA